MTTKPIYVENYSADGVDGFDLELFQIDFDRLEEIQYSFPKDNLIMEDDAIKLQQLCLEGMRICDKWLPIAHTGVAILETGRDKAKAKAVIYAGGSSGKVTAYLRTAYSETDEEYNRFKVLVEKMKALKQYLTLKKDTFKTTYFFFRDQGKNNPGSDLLGNSDINNNSEENIYQEDTNNRKINWK